MSTTVAIVPTGTANVASVEAALARSGASTHRTTDAGAVLRASHVVLPGVGTFAAAMERLARGGLGDALRERVGRDRPTLAVCVGMQVLARASAESPGIDGLGVWPGVIRRFQGGVRVPQLGWSRVERGGDACPPGWAYFAHSYALFDPPGEGWTVAWSEHGERFAAALSRGAVLACQYHPELSGSYGAERIAGWLAGRSS